MSQDKYARLEADLARCVITARLLGVTQRVVDSNVSHYRRDLRSYSMRRAYLNRWLAALEIRRANGIR